MKVLEVKIPGKPVAWSRTGGGSNGHRYNTGEHESWLAFAGVYMRQAARGRERVDGPVRVDYLAVLERPARLTGTARKPVPRGRLPAPRTPDVDNVGKLVCDALKRAELIKDDAQVVRVDGEKVYAAVGELPCVWVRLTEVYPMGEAGLGWPVDAVEVADRLF